MTTELSVDVRGVTLRVKVWPNGRSAHPAVVLLPATGETADDWNVVAAAIGSSRTVYAVNLRGHGPSDWPGTYTIRLMADDIAGLLARLDDRPVDLVGHSLGGLVAAAVAAPRPELVRRLVLEDIGLLRPRPPVPLSRPESDLPFDWRVIEQVRPEIDNPDPGWPDVIAAISAPTLVIAGGPRSHIPQEHVADLMRLLADSRIVTLDTGHLVHATSPAKFTRHLETFLDSPTATSPDTSP